MLGKEGGEGSGGGGGEGGEGEEEEEWWRYLAPLGLRFIVDREVGDFNCVEDLL